MVNFFIIKGNEAGGQTARIFAFYAADSRRIHAAGTTLARNQRGVFPGQIVPGLPPTLPSALRADAAPGCDNSQPIRWPWPELLYRRVRPAWHTSPRET